MPTLSIMHPPNDGFYSDRFLMMLVNCNDTHERLHYMVMGRMLYKFTTKGSVFGVRGWRLGMIFVLLDVFAFLVQLAGAAIASGNGKSTKTIMLGLHIYMGGIGFQQLCIFASFALAARFRMNLRQQPASPERRTAFRLLYVEFVLLMTIRIFFRLIEYSKGLESTLPQHEVFQYVLHSTPLLIALVLLNIFRSGFLISGKESDMPARKERKAMKKQGQQPGGRRGEYMMMGKQGFMTDDRDASEAETGLMPPSPPIGAYRYGSYDHSRAASPAAFGA